MAEKSMNYIAEFHFSNDSIPEFLKTYVKDEFVKARNEAIKLLNPRYEEWNAEFDRLYGKREDYEYDEEYNSYIRSKQNEVLNNNFNKYWFGLVTLYSDEWCDICGKVKLVGQDEFTVSMSLKPLD